MFWRPSSSLVEKLVAGHILEKSESAGVCAMFDWLFSRILPIMVVPNGTATISRQGLITLANVALFCWISGLTTGFFGPT
jgi:hypothetical protein